MTASRGGETNSLPGRSVPPSTLPGKLLRTAETFHALGAFEVFRECRGL
jgi:hypothetical protein